MLALWWGLSTVHMDRALLLLASDRHSVYRPGRQRCARNSGVPTVTVSGVKLPALKNCQTGGHSVKLGAGSFLVYWCIKEALACLMI